MPSCRVRCLRIACNRPAACGARAPTRPLNAPCVLLLCASTSYCLPAATQEPCDLRLEYLAPEDLGLSKSDLPRGLWPAPKRHLPPFHEGFTDFVRVVAPGVYVG